MSGTILIVDDDETICDLVAEALSPHHVVAAGCGEDALRVLRASTDIDVLITDLVLPGRYDGFALARQAKALHPRLHVLYASGYFTGLPPADDNESFYGKFIAKPFRPSELRAEVARTLAETHEARGNALRRVWRQGAAA